MLFIDDNNDDARFSKRGSEEILDVTQQLPTELKGVVIYSVYPGT